MSTRVRLALLALLVVVAGSLVAVVVLRDDEPAAAPPPAAPSPTAGEADLLRLPALQAVGVPDALRARQPARSYAVDDQPLLPGASTGARPLGEVLLTAQGGPPLASVDALQWRVVRMSSPVEAQRLYDASIAGGGLGVAPLGPQGPFGPGVALALVSSPGGYPQLTGYAVQGSTVLAVTLGELDEPPYDQAALEGDARALVPVLFATADAALG